MRTLSRTPTIGLVACLVAGSLGGCAGQLKPEDLAAGATGALASIPKAAAQLAEGVKSPVGTATEIYTRVARGALTCWLGAYGPLKGTHLFQAEAEPLHKGGRSEIAIHQRVPDSPNQPGKRVFEVKIEPNGGSGTVEAHNLHLPAGLADSMRADVQRWAANDEGCLPHTVTAGGWSADPAAAPAPAAAGSATAGGKTPAARTPAVWVSTPAKP